jgi:hypothetical protein
VAGIQGLGGVRISPGAAGKANYRVGKRLREQEGERS